MHSGKDYDISMLTVDCKEREFSEQHSNGSWGGHWKYGHGDSLWLFFFLLDVLFQGFDLRVEVLFLANF